MDIITTYEQFVDQFAEMIQKLDCEFEKPAMVPYAEYFVFRHNQKIRSDVLASFLKLVRIASLLNASLCVMKKGFVQEAYILCRAIDEAVDEITFLALKIDGDGASLKQMKMLKEFYQEQFQDPLNVLNSVPRDRVGRKDIIAAISNMPIESSDPHTRNKVVKSLHEVFSGFVHGAYVHIMEMYGGRPARFHMKGMPNSPYMISCINNFAHHLYRSVMMVEIVASRSGRQDIVLEALKLGCNLAEMTNCLDAESIKRLKDRISST